MRAAPGQRDSSDLPSEARTGLALARAYRPAWLKGDLAAGLTVGALLVTQCMAYAPLAGLPPNAAFHAVLVALPIYALLGTSRHLIVGPDPGTAAIAGTGLASVAAVGTTTYLDAAAALAVMVAVVLVVAGLLRLGFVASLLSRPALVGYLAGLGATLLVGQVPSLTGIPVPSGTFFERLRDVVINVGDLDPATTAMGLSTLALILVVKKVAKGWPAAVIGVVTATLVAWALSLDEHGIKLVGAVDADVPLPRFPDLPLHSWGQLVATAVGVGVLGYADSFLTAKGVATKEGYALDANRELTALGVANAAAGAFQGMPVASTGSGTAAASAAGGRTQATFVVAALVVLLGIVALSGVIARIPSAALAAVVVSAALSLIEVGAFRSLWAESRIELLLAVATFLAVCAFDVLAGIIISIALGLVIALYRIARPHDSILASSTSLDGWVPADQHDGTTAEPGLLVYRFDAPLFFVNAQHYAERVMAALDENPGDERWVVLDFEGVGSVDTTATEVIVTLIDDLERTGIEHIGLARANTPSLQRLQRAGLLAPEGPLVAYPTIAGSVRAFRAARGDGMTGPI